jgi:hypothetical protein
MSGADDSDAEPVVTQGCRSAGADRRNAPARQILPLGKSSVCLSLATPHATNARSGHSTLHHKNEM